MPEILLSPLMAVLISQISKVLIGSNRLKLNWRSLFAYSGMPSSHAAMTISLCVIIALTQGLSSPLFAISLIFTTLIIRDALGLRRYVGQQGKIINVLIKDLQEDDMGLDENYPRLAERIGHTPAQVIAGSIIGFLTSLIFYYFL